MIRQLITVRNTFSGQHHWPNAPEAVLFLRYPHRHLFIVRTTVPVNHEDRHQEFFLLQRRVDEVIRTLYPRRPDDVCHDLGSRSCEAVARELLEAMSGDQTPPVMVSVSEDGENEGVAILDPNS